MNHIPTPSNTPDIDRYARRLAAHLSAGTEELRLPGAKNP